MRAGWLAALLLVGCGSAAPDENTELQDIFRNDVETRTPATVDQRRWTVSLGGCTGSMLARDVVLTAAHCSPRVGATYTSGGCLALGTCSRDLRVTQVLEQSGAHDYAILKVERLNAAAVKETRYAPAILVDAKTLVVGRDGGNTTALVTVGFPGDKQGPWHATGFAKRLDARTLAYNVGSINGNSGGAIWRASDMTLVSQTNFGPHMLGQSGWKNNDLENPRAWNGGGRMDVIYAQSRVLQTLFPNGKNPAVNSDGRLKGE